MKKTIKNTVISLLIAMLVFYFAYAPISSSAYSFDNGKSFSNKIVMGDAWSWIANGKRLYTSRSYFGVTISSLKTFSGSSAEKLSVKILNTNEVQLASTQTVYVSSYAIYRFPLLVTTNDAAFLVAKGPSTSTDYHATGIFYVN